MTKKYANYEDIDQVALQKDIDDIKNRLGNPTWEDFQHLKKLELWGRISFLIGFLLLVGLAYFNTIGSIGTLTTSLLVLLSATLIGVANVSRWANVAHPILHGAYDKVPNIPFRYTKAGFAKGWRRYIDWIDWIKPEAWQFEHNIMHHFHLGEIDDPDNVEKNLVWLHEKKYPIFVKYMIVYAFAFLWKLTYYAPNTLLILANKERIKNKEPRTYGYVLNPFKKNGFVLWKDYILPYGVIRFVLFPALFLPFGIDGFLIALLTIFIAEIYANLHSFLVIVPNHSAEDIYRFSTPHKSQGEFYLRQIMGSVNYTTGTDRLDFLHGFLNYQVEHHIFPDRTLLFYQKSRPIIEEICEKHNLEYREGNVFKRLFMSIELMVGKTKLLEVEGV